MSLLALRKNRNVSQEELANFIGVSPSMISRYEHGLSIPPADKVVKMAEYLHTSVDSIMDYRQRVIDSDGSSAHDSYYFGQGINEDRVQIITSEIDDIVLDMANGRCELCGLEFQKKTFLEAHYVVWARDGGRPTLTNTVALCPNCHKMIHREKRTEDLQKLAEIAANHKI